MIPIRLWSTVVIQLHNPACAGTPSSGPFPNDHRYSATARTCSSLRFVGGKPPPGSATPGMRAPGFTLPRAVIHLSRLSGVFSSQPATVARRPYRVRSGPTLPAALVSWMPWQATQVDEWKVARPSSMRATPPRPGWPARAIAAESAAARAESTAAPEVSAGGAPWAAPCAAVPSAAALSEPRQSASHLWKSGSLSATTRTPISECAWPQNSAHWPR